MGATEQGLFDLLSRLGIATRTVRHPAAHTVAEAKAVRGPLAGGHAKSLLLRDRRAHMVLVVVDEDRRLNTRVLARRLGLGRLSFASPARLFATLGVPPGAVTPFALINRRNPSLDSAPLLVVLDRSLMDREPLHFHPLHNAATTAISGRDLLRFIEYCGYQPLILDFAAMERDAGAVD